MSSIVSHHQKPKHFGEQTETVQKKKHGAKSRETLAKLARAFMLPVAMLPIAGLALGIGTTINSQTSSDFGKMIGNIIMMPGSIIFALLPILFGIAVAITFTNDSGTAALSTILGYAVFIVFQSALIVYPHGTDPNYHYL
jgi:PTS system glucose-specific IIC component